MGEAPRISLIVPVYNAAPWVNRCLSCLQRQTFADWECILINDGSTDESGAICDEWVQKDERFRVIHQLNGGAASARNTGLAAAQGYFVVFCDADDITSPLMLEWAWMLHEQYPGDVIVWDIDRNFDPVHKKLAETIDPAVPVERMGSEQDHAYSLLANYSSVINKLLPMEIIRRADLHFDPSFVCYEDHTFMRAFSAAYFQAYPQGAYRHLKAPLYGYVHQNPDSLSTRAVSEESIELEANYLQKVLPECEQAMASWGDISTADPKMVGPTVMHYFTAFAYGLYCAHQLKEEAPNLWQTPIFKMMLQWSKNNKAYTAYYLPFCWRLPWLARFVYWAKQKNINLYWKLYEAGYLLLGRNWIRF